jgi:hypothetical protein
MASALSPPSPAQRLSPAATFRGRARAASRFCALGLALALPLLGFAIWAHQVGLAAPTLQYVEHRASQVTAAPGLSHLDYVYPPLPVLLALLLPGGPFGLAIVACLFSGMMLAYLVRRIGFSRDLLVLLPMVAVPAMWYTASNLLPAVVALTFLAVALQGFIRFATEGETYGGFIAGLALAVSYSADPSALVYAGVMCAAVPLIGAARYHGDPQAPIGVCAVLVFPCVAAAACWSFLLWKFSGNWPGSLAYSLNADVLGFPDGILGGIGHAVTATLTDLARSELYVVAVVLVGVRRQAPAFSAALVLPVVALALGLWLGFDYSSVTAYFLFTLLAVTVITQFSLMEDRVAWWILVAAVGAQVIIAIAWAPASPGFSVWSHHLFG